MFNAILDFLGSGIAAVFTLFGQVFSGGIGLIYAESSLTSLGELLLLGAVVGLALWGINFVRSMIPFLR